MSEKTFHHVPVLYDEVMKWMNPVPQGVYADGTLGGGGHSEGILKSTQGQATLYGIDRDENAILAASERLKVYPNFRAIHGNFHDAKALLEEAQAPKLTGALLDLGVSSHQLDTADRGFSYHSDAPLDMRMDQSRGQTAAEYLATIEEQELRRVLTEYGEEKWSARIASIFMEKRAQHPILTTSDLVAVVDAAIPKAIRRKDDGHPARRTFQAVRIALNEELDPLSDALRDFVDCLEDRGRLLVITFHSLEDRLVKNAFRKMQNPCTCPPKMPICICGQTSLGKVLGGGAIKPSKDEVTDNVRSRSATLRVFERRIAKETRW